MFEVDGPLPPVTTLFPVRSSGSSGKTNKNSTETPEGDFPPAANEPPKPDSDAVPSGVTGHACTPGASFASSDFSDVVELVRAMSETKRP